MRSISKSCFLKTRLIVSSISKFGAVNANRVVAKCYKPTEKRNGMWPGLEENPEDPPPPSTMGWGLHMHMTPTLLWNLVAKDWVQVWALSQSRLTGTAVLKGGRVLHEESHPQTYPLQAQFPSHPYLSPMKLTNERREDTAAQRPDSAQGPPVADPWFKDYSHSHSVWIRCIWCIWCTE